MFTTTLLYQLYLLTDFWEELSGHEDCELVKRALKEKWVMYSLDGGPQTLTDRLAESVREMSGDIKLDSPVTSLKFTTGKAKVKMVISNTAQNNYVYGKMCVQVHVGDNYYEVDHFISTIPSNGVTQHLL